MCRSLEVDDDNLIAKYKVVHFDAYEKDAEYADIKCTGTESKISECVYDITKYDLVQKSEVIASCFDLRKLELFPGKYSKMYLDYGDF